jgi:hypothetical protein
MYCNKNIDTCIEPSTQPHFSGTTLVIAGSIDVLSDNKLNTEFEEPSQ